MTDEAILYDLLVVGGGLTGCVAARLAERQGLNVLVLDDGQPTAGSRAAGGLFKDSWLSGFPKEERIEAIRTLDSLVGTRTFRAEVTVLGVSTGREIELSAVPVDRILERKNALGRIRFLTDAVIDWKPELNRVRVIGAKGARYQARVCYFATGVWSRIVGLHLTPPAPLAGIVAREEGTLPDRFQLWAPYKQAIGFQITPKEFWFGDGTAIQKKNFELTKFRTRAEATFQSMYPRRCNPHPDSWRMGLRPYVKGAKTGFFRQVADRTYWGTGGAKNGVIVAAHMANLLMKENFR